MAYVSRMIAHGETLIGISRLHWINVIQGLLWLVILMAIGFSIEWSITYFLGALTPQTPWRYAGVGLTWIELFCICAGLYIFSIYFLNYVTSEIALTNQRIIHKRGLIFIKIEETNLEEVKGATIDTGYLGWLFGYGAIRLDARFVHDAKLPFMNKPYRFIAAMTEAQKKLDDNLSLVIEEGDNASKAHLRHAKHVHVDKEVEHIPDDDSEEIPPTLAEEGKKPARPKKAVHQVAEGSYEEEKLKEELSHEWEDHCDEEKAAGNANKTLH